MKNAQNIIEKDKALEMIMSIIDGSTTPNEVIETKPIKTAPTIIYENGRAIEVDGKKVAVGPKKKGGKRTAKNDPGREALRSAAKDAIEAAALYNKKVFEHSTEGLVISLIEADYTLKVSKSKENKFDTTEEGFKAEKDFSVRGKTKNSAPGIAKTILVSLDENVYTLCEARASGITVQCAEGEYTIKISKKRDRVGFEAEKAAAYDK